MARCVHAPRVHSQHHVLPLNSIPVLDAAAILKQHRLRPDPKLGQNFLQDPEALQRIVAAAGVSPTDVVLEIGCGLGHLTRYLAVSAQRVVAVELDRRLAALATEILGPYRNVQVISGDILALSPTLLDLPADYLVAANIPSNITSPIIRHLLEAQPRPRRIVLTVQAEVADRICGRPPRMSLLALSVQVYAAAEIVAHIPARAFLPVPKVDSAVVRIDAYGEPRIASPLLPSFFALAKAGFGQKRKTLRNNFAAGLRLGAARAQELIGQAGIDPRRRAETLGLEEWDALCRVQGLKDALAAMKPNSRGPAKTR